MTCQTCGVLLLGYESAPQRQPSTAVPFGQVTLTEHQAHTLVCPCWGTTNRGALPREVVASQLGPNRVSLIGVLMGC